MISKAKILIVMIIFFVLAGFSGYFFLSAPKDFPSGAAIVIEKGTGLAEISGKLKKEGFIKNKYAFALYARSFGKSKKIKYGQYLFNESVSIFSLLSRFTKGEFGFKPVKVTVAEGLTVKKIAELLGDFENFDKEEFLEKTGKLEGYLFPDTYLFLPFAETEQIIGTMTDNFKKKAGDIGRDIVIMASLIEKEVPDSDDRKIVSGILWKRLKLGMALQVDAVFPYITGKQKGLPPGPISNPGLDAIEAAKNPKETPYLYYLSCKDGKTRFAKTFSEHLRNKEKYLQ